MAAAKFITINAPARLHFGFSGGIADGTADGIADGTGGLGRSVGMAIDDFGRLRMSCRLAERTTIAAPQPLRRPIADYLEKWRRLFHHHRRGVAIEVASHPPLHSGLGSGTQLAVSLAYALGQIMNVGDFSLVSTAKKLGRMRRSAVGLNVWLGGGFIIGGVGEGAGCRRYSVPGAWRLLLIIDENSKGLFGRDEERAFAEPLRFDDALAARLDELTARHLPDALAAADFAAFADAISELQTAMGRIFTRFQGGDFTSPRIAAAMESLAKKPGIGQSSWGPSAFAFFADEETAATARTRLAAAHPDLITKVVRADNRGAITKSLA